jgi:hypothetical protein
MWRTTLYSYVEQAVLVIANTATRRLQGLEKTVGTSKFNLCEPCDREFRANRS